MKTSMSKLVALAAAVTLVAPLAITRPELGEA